MDMDKALALSASGLEVQRRRMNVIASNLANVNSTKSAAGGPYRRRDLLIRAEPVVPQPFKAFLGGSALTAPAASLAAKSGYPLLRYGNGSMSGVQDAPGVRVVSVVEDPRPPRRIYEPHHPDADSQGYVLMPDINVFEEMVNLITASRAYEANVTAMGITKTMAQRALEIGR